MRSTTPIYKSGSRKYSIDTCAAQQRAIAEGKIGFRGWTTGHYPGSSFPGKLLPGISSIGYMDSVGEQDWGIETHRNEGIEIVLQETGKTAFDVDGVRYQLKAGDLTITKPWQLHTHGAPNLGPGRLHWLILDVGVRRPNQEWKWPAWVGLVPADLRELTHKLRRIKRPVWPAPDTVPAFRTIAECLESPKPAAQCSRVILSINLILLEILDVLRNEKANVDDTLVSKSHTVELFLKDLAENQQSLASPWTLESMAAQCGLGATAFTNYCRAITNTSPLKYLVRARLENAARRLRQEPDRSVTEIAFACGFSSSQYFATQFRRQFGCPPMATRK